MGAKKVVLGDGVYVSLLFYRLKRDLAPAKGDIFELRETHQPTHAQRDVYMTSTHTHVPFDPPS